MRHENRHVQRFLLPLNAPLGSIFVVEFVGGAIALGLELEGGVGTETGSARANDPAVG